MKNSLIIIMMAMAISTQAGAAEPESIRIAGDPCTIPLAKKLGEAFTQKTGVAVTVDAGGCRTGVSKVIDGAVDIGVSTFNFIPGQLHSSVVETVIAKAPIVMVVNKANPVENLTSAQLHDILSGKTRNWKEVGGVDMAIKNVMLPPCVVETMTHQTDTHGAGPNLSKMAKEGNPVANTNLLVAENPAAIGMQLYGHDDETVKVLRIDGILPEKGAVPGRYPYYENYNIITMKNPEGAVKKFLAFAASEEGKQIMLAMRHIPEQ